VIGEVGRRARGAVVAHAIGIVSQQRVVLGKTGEDLACRELTRRGYAILARRWRRRQGEIDIVARDGATLVFVEVKTRDGRAFGDAADAVTAYKRRRLSRLAQEYVTCERLHGCACRFDVVSIHVEAARPVVTVFQNAFDASECS
jgi:putative endonuclease